MREYKKELMIDKLNRLTQERLKLLRLYRKHRDENTLTPEVTDEITHKLDYEVLVSLGSANHHLTYELSAEKLTPDLLELREQYRKQITLANLLYGWLNPEV